MELEPDNTQQNINVILENYHDLEELMDLVIGLLPAFADRSREDCNVEDDKAYLLEKIERILI